METVDVGLRRFWNDMQLYRICSGLWEAWNTEIYDQYSEGQRGDLSRVTMTHSQSCHLSYLHEQSSGRGRRQKCGSLIEGLLGRPFPWKPKETFTISLSVVFQVNKRTEKIVFSRHWIFLFLRKQNTHVKRKDWKRKVATCNGSCILATPPHTSFGFSLCDYQTLILTIISSNLCNEKGSKWLL